MDALQGGPELRPVQRLGEPRHIRVTGGSDQFDGAIIDIFQQQDLDPVFGEGKTIVHWVALVELNRQRGSTSLPEFVKEPLYTMSYGLAKARPALPKVLLSVTNTVGKDVPHCQQPYGERTRTKLR